MRCALAILVACAGCNPGTAGAPRGFGVNVTVDATDLSSVTLKSAAKADLFVYGAEDFQTTFDVAKPIQDGRLRFRYVPGVTQGTLGFSMVLKNAAGEAIAGGSSQDVELVAGRAVEALIELAAGAGNGTACASAGECISGHCSDGICCDSRCDGLCESCAVVGHEGECTPIPDDSDPDNECLPAAAPEDGGSSDDAGEDPDGGGIERRVPDGGIVADPVKCKGLCNGQRACKFPSVQTGCGTTYCSLDDEMTQLHCDGEGRCVPELETCVAFTCGPDACKGSCTAHSDCLPTHYCDGATQKCLPKKSDGLTCGTADECVSTFCVPHPTGAGSPVCCNTECSDAATQTCHQTGNVGKCQCQGVVCPAGVACRIYYYDGDRDSYGDKTASAVNMNIKPGCDGFTLFCTTAKADPAPSPAASPLPCTATNNHWVANKTDCRDDKSAVHPGQASWFKDPIDVGGSSWDYNCNNSNDKYIREFPAGSTCGYCVDPGFMRLSYDPRIDIGPSPFGLCDLDDRCKSTSTQSALTCCSGTGCGSIYYNGCEADITKGFVGTANCGYDSPAGTGKYTECGKCSVVDGLPSVTHPAKTQLCH